MWDAHEAPGKTTAFLFTDIVGSTERWDADRAAMQAALRRHDAILRAAIERGGGRVFKTIGDAFCAAFESVGAALSAAVAAQRDLACEDWRAVNGLRVRMAIHAGEAEARDDDYFGPAVNRVARLLPAGHGGQVLVSGAAADLAAANPPAGIGLRALGMLPLRSFKTPERVFQVTAEGLQAEFKPLRALETPPNNLPRQVSSFVGRHADVAQVEAMLRSAPLVTIVGTGGVGKTRLALAAAGGVLNDTREGAWFVDLGPIADPALVSSTILTATRADQASDVPAFDLLLAYLEKRGLLLVLDNCEHLIAEVARIVAAISIRCPQVTVLATSREPLNLTGERVYRLSSLDDDAAVQLFAERAQAVNPAFSIDAENRATVKDLCRRLDGIALAIELAAARIRSVSLDELTRRLRLRVLVGGARDRQPRQQTMRALVDWSYELLSPGERGLFRALAVFAGGFTLEAAAGVFCDDGDEWDVLDRVASLADKSLLAIETGTPERRYRLLEPIREYARERLDESGESEGVLARHVATFAAIAARTYVEWDSGPRPDWLARTSDDLDNFRTALAWALDDGCDPAAGAAIAAGTSPLFLRLSLLHEGIALCERAQHSGGTPLGSAARLSYGLSMLYHNQGSNAKALAAARSAVELYRAAGDDRGLTRALSQVAHHLSDAHDEALAVAEQALTRARALGDRRLLAATLQRCAFVYSPLEIEAARSRFGEAVELFRALGRNDETARALAAWADAESNAGDAAAAVGIARDALAIAPDDSKIFLFNLLASCFVVLNDRENALPATREAFALATKSAHPIATPCAVLYLAALESDLDVRNAARLAAFARARFDAAGWELTGPDLIIEQRLADAFERRLSLHERAALRSAGAAWSDAEGIAQAARV